MQTLLSEHWHAVRFLRPRLRDGVQPLHRRLRGKPWVLLLDPLTQRFHRMTPQVWRVLQLLDGRRTLDEVWEAACAQAEAARLAATAPALATALPGGLAGASASSSASTSSTRPAAARPAAPDLPEAGTISQHELVQLMSTLYANDLLQTQVSPDAGEVFQRYQKQRRALLKQSWLNPMSIRIPLLHPDKWFQRQAGLARSLASWPVLLLWLAIVAPAVPLAAQHWQALTENLSDRVLSAGNLALLWFIYPAVKAVHEWAHGMAVKAWGGQVREIGLMFIIFTPVPYVDATSSYRFPSKWSRAAVAAAGIMAELVLGAIALYVWLLAEPGLVTAVAYNVVLIAGVSTLLVNGNPLMRYDGYFIACDLMELPNLAQRSTQYWAYLVDRYGFGAREARPPVEARGERWILLLYGAVAPIYRLFITIGLIWFVAGEYLFVGAVMAVMAAWQALVMPVWKWWKHLRESPSLVRKRDSALRRTVLAVAVAGAFIGLVPMPFHSVHHAVVWLPDEAIVRAQVPGHINRVWQAPGQPVAAGAPLLQLDSPSLQADLGSAAAAVAQAEAQLRKAQVAEPVRTDPLKVELAQRQARLAENQRRVQQIGRGCADQRPLDAVSADRAGRPPCQARRGAGLPGGRPVRPGARRGDPGRPGPDPPPPARRAGAPGQQPRAGANGPTAARGAGR